MILSHTAADVTRAFHSGRAERFGTQFVEPGKREDLRLEFRKEKLKKDGFKTGIDIYDEVRQWSVHYLLGTPHVIL